MSTIKRLIGQISRFTIVGLAVSGVRIVIVVILTETAIVLNVFIANTMAFS